MCVRVCVCTHIVVDEDFDPVLGVVQVPEALEELGQEGGGLLDEDAHLHAGKLLFTPDGGGGGGGRSAAFKQTPALYRLV